ncbi:hypothetical protein BS50DRAFT_153238 [Corynespora cassiicola Philippines]|uniref:Zn(2)-C6 fungal-type domain-containing protein n=1 Tax=Corynespora cassiicola Philippines TaxID=1448308 RepID=A0A2T2N7V1_CORCC|nr:hypothetical protein BS50DRAFT_153238 [Corynespora cassiicola Philippines]
MDHSWKCEICKKRFTQKSSLVRHSKRCTPGPAPSLRQKSCRQCTSSKTKCDLQRPKCSRCAQRGTMCQYIVPMTRGTRKAYSPERTKEAERDHGNTPAVFTAPESVVNNCTGVPSFSSTSIQMDFDAPVSAPFDLCNTLDDNSPVTNMLQGRGAFPSLTWPFPNDPIAPIDDPCTQYSPDSLDAPLLSNSTTPDSTEFILDIYDPGDPDLLIWRSGAWSDPPPLVRRSMENLLCVMKTWPKMLAKGLQTPPMFHYSHTMPETMPENMRKPMANCVALAKMWVGQSTGACEMVRQAIMQEMRSLFEQYKVADERELLSILQSLVMLIIMLMFPARDQAAVCLLDPALFLAVQKLITYAASTGLIIPEEVKNKRPLYECWIHTTAKRRALFCLYLLHWSYSVYHGLRSFSCAQLNFMPAPAPKFLWHADSKEKWGKLYDRWLVEWNYNPFMMREFRAILAGASLEPRAETWLEETDELGILFFTIVNATHREEPQFESTIPVFTSLE